MDIAKQKVYIFFISLLSNAVMRVIMSFIWFSLLCSILSLDTVYAASGTNKELIDKEEEEHRGILIISLALFVALCTALGVGVVYVLDKYQWFSFSIAATNNTVVSPTPIIQSYDTGYSMTVDFIYNLQRTSPEMLREEIVALHQALLRNATGEYWLGATQAAKDLFNTLDIMPDISKEDFYNLIFENIVDRETDNNVVMVSSLELFLKETYQVLIISIIILLVIYLIYIIYKLKKYFISLLVISIK